MKTRLVVELEAPEGATNEDVVEYVDQAVRGWGGGEHPQHPMYELDRKSVEVRIEAKLVSLPAALHPKIKLDTAIEDGAWICEACRERGDRSFVMVTNETTRGARSRGYGDLGYADPDGVVHRHANIYRETNYGCERGHRWQATVYEKCEACGWQQEADKREPMQDDNEAGRKALARSIEMLTPAGMGGLAGR